MNTFNELKLNNWRQFHDINIDFRDQVTILTGQNGAGKTTILNVLSNHFGWNINFIRSLQIGKNKKKKIWSDLKQLIFDDNDNIVNQKNIGYIKYSNNIKCELFEQNHENPQYQLKYSNKQTVSGINIPSHRPSIAYQKIDSIPTDPKSNQQMYQEYNNTLLQTYTSTRINNPGLLLKKGLISLGVFGYGNQALLPNREYKELFEEFQNILRILLPPDIGFERIEIRMPDVTLVTKTGDFSLDAMSGGINALFGIAWQIHMFSTVNEASTVIIDEPENHLHPSMQRTIIPSFAKAFPNHKFIIASHSPFVVTSLPESKVYGLVFNQDREIISQEIENADLSGTPNKTLREILDVDSNIPIWVEEKIKDIINSSNKIEEANDKASFIFEELDKLGFTDHISELEIGEA